MRRQSISPDWILLRQACIALVRATVVVALLALPAAIEVRDDTQDSMTTQPPATTFLPVPEPASLLLFGTGLAGLAGLTRRLHRRSAP